MLMGKRIVCDKSINSVILEAPNFVLIRKKRIIPFTDVKGVEITYNRISSGQGGSRDGWQVSLDMSFTVTSIGLCLSRSAPKFDQESPPSRVPHNSTL